MKKYCVKMYGESPKMCGKTGNFGAESWFPTHRKVKSMKELIIATLLVALLYSFVAFCEPNYFFSVALATKL
jgi:hypothetical protein